MARNADTGLDTGGLKGRLKPSSSPSPLGLTILSEGGEEIFLFQALFCSLGQLIFGIRIDSILNAFQKSKKVILNQL